MNEHRASIPRVPDGRDRPRWSVMIPTYNCAGYLRETLRSVLDQDPGPETMQIEVVDDCSTDDPAAVVGELADERVTFYRQDENIGHTRNFDTCLVRASGELVHILHGDDAVRPGFYGTMEVPFGAHPELGAAFCRQVIVDDDGNWLTVSELLEPKSGILDGWFARIAAAQRLQTPAMVVRRSVYEHVGGFDDRIRKYGEDWEMWVRIAAEYPVWFEVEPLAIYRLRSSSLSGETLRRGENVDDLLRVVQINEALVPGPQRRALSRAARRSIATASVRRGRRLLAAGETSAAWAQVRGALRASRATRVLADTAVFSAAAARNRLRSLTR
jgi:glycosyltransferase involved in cell wall biosynthesis